ncbi:dehydrogenase/reductase SDR family protein 7-like isoform X2 [Centruroides vittatus]|uniref:dehydrogenase/reductase SDR family protein 7-like isoform X2 n=1 Tax=Centruroides vittatus TaxID=120091 RepID=UPI0035102504
MDEDIQAEMISNIKYWFRLVIGGICLPVVFPWLVYQLYNSRLKNKIRRNRYLEDKVVLITGASSGLGESLAHKFYTAGSKVILSARRKEELERVKNDLLNLKVEKAHEPAILILDLNELREIPFKANEALDIFGKIDILVNNGGISYRGEIISTSVDVDLRILVVNYLGHVTLTKALLPSMIKQNNGHIIAISSIQGKIAIPFRSAYSASKHALQAFFDVLRSELGETNIHTCIVSPGYIKTNLSINALTDTGSTYGVMDKTTSTGMDPNDVADAIIDAVLLRKNELILSTLLPQLALLLRIMWPSLYFYLMQKRAYRLRNEKKFD